MKTLKLKNIAKIQSGYSLRTKLKRKPNGKFSLILPKDLTNDFSINVSDLEKSDELTPKEHHFVTKNDVLYLARGMSNKAVFISQKFESAIATSYFFTIRVKSKLVLPEFLAWALNNGIESKRFLSKRIVGSAINSVSKQTLLELPIEIPTLETQKQIVKLNELFLKEKQLTQKLLLKKETLIQGILKQNLSDDFEPFE